MKIHNREFWVNGSATTSYGKFFIYSHTDANLFRKFNLKPDLSLVCLACSKSIKVADIVSSKLPPLLHLRHYCYDAKTKVVDFRILFLFNEKEPCIYFTFVDGGRILGVEK